MNKNFNRKRVSQAVMVGRGRRRSYVVVGILFFIIGFIVIKGIGVINWEFLTTAPEDGITTGGIFPAIVDTYYLVVGSMLVAFPIGVMSEI